MSKPITLESFEIDDYNENVSINCVDQSSLTEAGRKSGFIAHWHVGEFAEYIVEHCEDMRQHYLKLQEQMKAAEDADEHKRLEHESYLVWKELIRWLPEGWLQKRTITMTYENLHAMCSKSQRYFHKLNEWSGRRDNELENFIEWVRKEIPYAEDFILYHETEDEVKKNEELLKMATYYLEGFLEQPINNNPRPMAIPLEFHSITEEKWNEIAKEVVGKHHRRLGSNELLKINCFIKNGYLMVSINL